jgi:hypothetical protein
MQIREWERMPQMNANNKLTKLLALIRIIRPNSHHSH